jgi:hypothetical protein
MKTDKVVKKLGAGAKNNTDCQSFSYGIWSFPTVIPSHGINPTEFFCIVWCIPSFENADFFQKFVLAPPQEVLGDERRNEWYAPTS